jgi:hypothetical protein
MIFSKLTHPYYVTDQAESAANPIQPVRAIWLPGIICDECGSTWAGSRRLYLPIADTTLWRRLRGAPLPKDEWEELADTVHTTVGLPYDFDLKPGDVLGSPVAELLSSDIPDFLHPFPGQLIVRASVVDVLRDAELTGFQPVRVEARWGNRVSPHPAEAPVLYELVVTGSAWRVGSDRYYITACKHCGRAVFPNPDWLIVDEDRWDKSDFFHVDDNPNIVLVTERVCAVLAQYRFTNYACVPVSQGDQSS